MQSPMMFLAIACLCAPPAGGAEFSLPPTVRIRIRVRPLSPWRRLPRLNRSSARRLPKGATRVIVWIKGGTYSTSCSCSARSREERVSVTYAGMPGQR